MLWRCPIVDTAISPPFLLDKGKLIGDCICYILREKLFLKHF